MREAQLKSYLCQRLARDFEIRPEVQSVFAQYDTKVVIDYLMHPKQHLIARGFDDVWFGVEVKSPRGRAGGLCSRP